MTSAKLPLSSPFAKGHFGRGFAEGEVKGEAEGRMKGMADALRVFLYARGFQLTEQEKARIASCPHIELLQIWVVRAATVASAAEMF